MCCELTFKAIVAQLQVHGILKEANGAHRDYDSTPPSIGDDSNMGY